MHEYNAKLIKVVDGDTCDALIDLGFDTWVKKRIRFHGVDTWESRTRDLEEKKKGLEAKDFTKVLLTSNDGKFTLQCLGVGKYGRCLGILHVKDKDESVNDLLIKYVHAYKYHGDKKKEFGGKK